MIDKRRNSRHSRSGAHWRADDKNLTLTLYVKGRARAEADPWYNSGTVYGVGLFRSRTAETVVTPMGLSVLDEIELMLRLPAPVPIIGREGRLAPELRREINEHNRHFSEKRYLNTDSRRAVIRLLNEAHDDLNKAAMQGRLTPGAGTARLKCAEAMQVLENMEVTGIPARAANAVREAARTIRRDDPPPGASIILSQSFHVRAAREKCGLALEHVERYERTKAAQLLSRSVENSRERER